MLHKITLGDWSGDGHEITQDFFFETTDQFTDEVLTVNYDKNVKELEINPALILNNSDDFGVPVDMKRKLSALDFANQSKPVNPKYGDDPWWDESEEDADFGPEGMARLILFLIGYDLHDFDYKFVDITPLVGGGRSSTPSVGYGLFRY